MSAKKPPRKHEWWKYPNVTVYYRPPGSPETWLDAASLGRFYGQLQRLLDFEAGKVLHVDANQLDKSMHARSSDTLPGNPYNLVRRQHVVSREHLSWFAGADGRVCVLHKSHPRIKPFFPPNKIFCAPRLWSDSVELWAHSIEEVFYREARWAASAIRAGKPYQIINQDAITDYWTLCRSRVRVLNCPPQPINLNNQVRDHFTQAEKDELEYEGFSIYSTHGDETRSDAAVMIRRLMLMDKKAFINAGVKWRIGTTPDDAVILPDLFSLLAVPITHNLIIFGDPESTEEAPPACSIENYEPLVAALYAGSRNFTVARTMATLEHVRILPDPPRGQPG